MFVFLLPWNWKKLPKASVSPDILDTKVTNITYWLKQLFFEVWEDFFQQKVETGSTERESLQNPPNHMYTSTHARTHSEHSLQRLLMWGRGVGKLRVGGAALLMNGSPQREASLQRRTHQTRETLFYLDAFHWRNKSGAPRPRPLIWGEGQRELKVSIDERNNCLSF